MHLPIADNKRPSRTRQQQGGIEKSIGNSFENSFGHGASLRANAGAIHRLASPALWQAAPAVTTRAILLPLPCRNSMIAFIRRWLTSPPSLILLALVLVAFAVTGIGDPFGSGAPQGSAAKVGDRTITEADLLKSFDQLIRGARERDPAISQTEIARQGGVAAAADQLIGQTAMEVLAAKAGIFASNAAIGAQIAAVPAFQVGGKFDEATYRRIIEQQRLSDRELHEGIGGDLARKQLLTPITAALGVPAGLALPYAQLLVDLHRGSVALVPSVPTAPPTEAEIRKFYAANAARLTLPERRAFRYAAIDSDAIAAGITIPATDIAAAFVKDPAKYGAAPTRKLQQVVVADETKARAIAAGAASEGFAAAAKRLAGFDAADIALGEQNQSAFGKATSPEVAAAAFAAPIGGITQPIKSAFGWHVVRAEAAGASGKTLAQASDAIAAELRATAARAKISDIVARIEDGAEAGKSFADLAAETGLTIESRPAVTKDGSAGPQTPGSAAPDPALAALAAKAFRHEPGDGAAVEDLGNGRLIAIETMQVLPAAPQPLADVRGFVTAAAASEKALAAARSKADAIVAAVRKGGDFAAAAAAQGLQPAQTLVGRRIDVAQQQNVPPVIQAFLNTPPGTVQVLPSPQGWVLIHSAAVEKGDVGSVPGLIDAGRRELASQLPDEFVAAFAAATERAVGTTRNDAVIAAVTRRLSGLDDAGQ
jgi:peptidyl-prolyl cis-trans isomerase D